MYNISVTLNPIPLNNLTQEIKVLVPEGFRDGLSIDTSTPARMCLTASSNTNSAACENVYRARVRGMLTKIPGFTFMSYRQIMFFASVIVSDKQYANLINNTIGNDQRLREMYDKLVEGYNFTNGIPKQLMFVKLDPNIDEHRRNFIANGIRSYFKDDITVLLDKQQLLSSIESSLALF
jgi:hypothetical protein